MREQIIDRCKGALYGLAIGDALGAAVEFRYPGEFAPVTGYRGLGPHGLSAGEWTDDTSMALALAASLKEGWDMNDQINRYIDWWQNGKYSVTGRCFDIGTTTRCALEQYLRTPNVLACADSDPASSGNGSIMRLAPIPIKYHALFPFDVGKLLDYAEQSSIPTHASQQCIDSCRFLAYLLVCYIHGRDKELPLVSYTGHSVPVVNSVIQGSYKVKSENTIVGGGWVVHCLEASLWSFWGTNSFEEAVLKAVNLGNDADTTGAVTGQIAGAFYGYSGIPQHLIDGLARKDMIDEALKGLYEES